MSDSKKVKVGAGYDDYNSDFEDDEEQHEDRKRKKFQREDLTQQNQPGCSKNASNHASGLPSRDTFETERGRADAYKYSYLSLNAFERHKKLINDYFLFYPGSKNALQRDTSRDKTDHDIVRDHHRFIWNDEDEADTWEKQMSKKYYDKLFKEYCICDLSFYQQGKYAMRWRTETEVINGNGQFICGTRKCNNSEGLRSWEVNFAYMENSIKKNALVKLRLCLECSEKLNYHQKRKDVTKVPKKKKKRRKEEKDSKKSGKEVQKQDSNNVEIKEENSEKSDNIWKDPVQVADVKSREEEFDEYLDDLFL